MQRTNRLSLRRVLASAVATALVASAAALGTAVPAQAAGGGEVTAGTMSWGIDAAYLSVFQTRANEAPAAWSGSTATFPATAASSSYDRATGTGTIQFSGTVRAGYFAGPPMPGVTEGNYFYLRNPRIVVDGTSGTLIAGTVAGSSHSLVPELPTHSGTDVAIATLDLSTVPATSATSVAWTSVPTAITAAGATYLAQYGSAGDAAGTVRAAGSALAPLSFSITTNAVAAATTTSLSVSPNAAAVAGSTVALTATVSPAAAGSVTFFDGTASLGTQPVSGATATLSTSSLAAGAHSLTAVFTPTDTAAYAGSTSSAVAYTVTDPTQQPVFDPAVSVFLADGVTPYTGQPVYTNDELVVRGTGFDPAANVGGRGMPIPNTLPQGSYVVFGSFLDNWKPSASATSASRKVVSQKWALTADTLAQVPSAFQGAVRGQWAELAVDGTFSATLTVKDADLALADGNWGVYTYGAGGVTNAEQELSVAINYVGDRVTPEPEPEPQPEPEPEPQPETGDPAVTVTPAADLDPAVQNVLQVEGSGFSGPGAANGAYVVFGETSVWSGGSALPATGWIAQAWVPAGQIVDGGFSTTLTIPAGQLDASKSYQVATSAAHGLSVTDRSLDTFTPVTVAQPVAPYVAFPLSASVQQGQTLSISGGGFAEGTVVTAIARSEPVTIGTATAGANGLVSFSWSVPASFEVGAHTLELSVDGQVIASAPFTVTAAAVVPAVEQPTAPACVARSVSGASIQWGVKESFRSYITGPIANGSISGGWGSGSGAYSTDTDRGRVSFGGSIHYTGHSGALDMTLSNPRIQINGSNSASLILNVQSKGFNGSPDTNAAGIVFATLSLPAANQSANNVSFSGASATLTAAGAEAFAGFYSAGTALDSVSFSLPLGAEVPCDSATGGNLAATGGTAPVDALWLGLGVLTLGALLTVVVRRRQRA